jgi:two-component system CheB/CheR fusion protein
MNPISSSAPIRIVALGGSAGALSALRTFFNAIPDDCGAAFVVLTHLGPERDTLLASCTRMPVRLAAEGVEVAANHVYVLPPAEVMIISHGKLYPRQPETAEQRYRPIDFFFQALALEQPDRALGVVLSGTIDDGSLGLVSLKNAGAATLVQEPSGAEFDGMPRNALKTGKVDRVLPPEALARAVCDWALTGHLPLEEAGPDVGESLEGVLSLVRAHAQRDLRGYKQATLQRRVERRMHLLHFTEMAAYQRYVEAHPQELDRLAKDLLIGVTAFFRDPEAFASLEKDVIPTLCAAKGDDTPVRAWIAGCSTGEEAYSVAIALFEWFAEAGLAPRVQVFATDIDEAALEVARAGRYSAAALSQIAPERLKRHFTRNGEVYKINKQVRESIVFAVHNLISDPPFSKLDLLVCRNVLIYLAPETQKRLITLFRFVLNKGGYLFLGSSETAGQTRKQFEIVSKQWRIYRSLSTPRVKRPELPLIPSTSTRLNVAVPEVGLAAGADAGHERVFRQIVETHGPTLLVVNRGNDILYISGATGPYLDFPSGEPSRALFDVVKPALRLALRSAINRARRTGGKTAAVAVRGNADDTTEAGVRITSSVVTSSDRRKLLLISFEMEAASSASLPLARPGGDDWVLRQLEQELNATREDLNRSIEKMRAGNEELKASNEEAMAMNEELQSANEELESSKEELQSLNEELGTANAMLDAKVSELEVTNTDLSNLLVSTEMATLFLDQEFRIKRFTPACTRLMHLIPSDVGRPVLDIAHRLEDKGLLDDGRKVLAGEPAITREVMDTDGNCYLRRALPYRALDARVAGVVVTFSDVTTMKQAQQEIATKAEELQNQARLLQHAFVLAKDMDDRIMFWNRGAELLYGWSQKEALGQVTHELLHTQFPEPLADIKAKLLRDGVWNGELVHQTRDGGKRVIAGHWDLYRDERGEPSAVVMVNNDITDSKQFERQWLASQSDLDYQAHHDALTHLPNRVLFRDRLRHAMALAQASGTRLALLFLDVDRFKTINDSLGHDVGDQLLQTLGNRLGTCLGRRETLARTGGDEFAVLSEGMEDITHASKLALDLIEAVKPPVRIDEHELAVSISVGISIYPDDTTKMEDLLKNADAAMFLAKDKGRAGYQFFTHELHQRASRFLAVETCLRRAIEQGELQLFLQPQVRLESGRICGAEALARWTSPDLGRVSPDEFIQVAEDSGLIVPLGEWAVRAACRQLALWRENGVEPVQIAVNVSAAQYQDANFIAMVEKALTDSGVPPHLLELELTERILLKDVNVIVSGMVALKRLGVHLSIDDFGTGFSSLSFLQRLPLDHLKVAREFIPQHPEDHHNFAIAQTIVTLARTLGLRCTVEGIETAAQLRPFKAWGCDLVQGFLVSQPVSMAEFTELLCQSPHYDI